MKGGRTERKGGFTLLEITITLAILGVVLGIVYGVFARALASKQHVESRAELSSSARKVLERSARDLDGAVPRLEIASSAAPAGAAAPTPAPTPPGAAGGLVAAQSVPELLFASADHVDLDVPFDEIAFSAFVPRPTSGGASAMDLATVRYFVVPDPERPAWRSLYREAAASLAGASLDPERPAPNQTALLLDGIAGVRFRFFDGEEWVEEWDSKDARDYALMPLAVEVALLVWGDGEDPDVYRTTVDLPIARTIARAPQLAGGRAGIRDREREEDVE